MALIASYVRATTKISFQQLLIHLDETHDNVESFGVVGLEGRAGVP